MNINKELDRIRGHGFKVVLDWGQRVTIISVAPHAPKLIYTIRKDDEQWQHCMNRAIFEFDEKYPELA